MLLICYYNSYLKYSLYLYVELEYCNFEKPQGLKKSACGKLYLS